VNILYQIREEVIDESISLSTALRRVLVLCSTVKHDGLKEWVLNELDGYSSDTHLPKYRILYLNSEGIFIDMRGRHSDFLPIPHSSLPPEVKEFAESTKMSHSVKELESMVRNFNGDRLAIPWPGDLIALSNSVPIYNRSKLLQAKTILSVGKVERILDSIRNMLLKFILQIIDENPEFNEKSESDKISYENVDEAYKSCISGSYSLE